MNTIAAEAKTQFEIGNSQRSKGQLEEAIASYRTALQLSPDFAEVHNNLGTVFFLQGRLEDAINSFRDALSSRPDYVDAYRNLGIVLHSLGRTQDAVDVYQKTLALNPKDAEVCNNLGTILLARGHPREAADRFRTALSLKPDYADANVNLGNALKAHGQLEEAIVSYGDALTLSPGIAHTHYALGSALSDLGHVDAAIASFRRALELDERSEFKTAFVTCIKDRAFRQVDAGFRSLVVRAIQEAWAWQSELANLATRLVRADEGIDAAVERASRAWPTPLGARELFGEIGLNVVVYDPLLRALLESTPICDVAMERFLTMVRRALLDAVTDAPDCKGIETEVLDFYCAVAQQCHINEYVYSCDDAELERAGSLRANLLAALDAGREIPAPWIAVVAAYWPMSLLPSAAELLGRPWPASLAAVLRQQITEPQEEDRDRAAVPRLTAVEGEVSRSVMQQYEENPYPRWIRVPSAGASRSLDELLRQEVPAAKFRPSGKAGDIEILIAGCGTGIEAIATAQRFPESRILAIDLSMSSLCYAQRKTREIGFENIEYAQADITRLGSIGRSFDLITSMGVLHHLQDPSAGLRELVSLLRPDGVIRLGLYSEMARQNVVAAREIIAARGYAPNYADMRRCRQDLMLWNDGAQFIQLMSSRDFFVMSEYRDLLFHTQEHRFNILQVKAMLAGFDLNFLGFATLDAKVTKEYVMRFQDDESRTNLDYWHYFETEFPDTFSGMYQFWCQAANGN